jgi:hypothetical protein
MEMPSTPNTYHPTPITQHLSPNAYHLRSTVTDYTPVLLPIWLRNATISATI